jgi:hypothetical protein
MWNIAKDFLPSSNPKSKIFVVRSYTNIKQMIEVEQMFSDLGETPFERLKEQPYEGMHNETIVEMQVTTINEYLFNFFKQGIVITIRASPFGSKPSKTC